MDCLNEHRLVDLPTKKVNEYCQKIAKLYYGKDKKPTVPIGLLIRGFFRYYTFFDTNYICQIREKELKEKENKNNRIFYVKGIFQYCF